MPILPPAGPVRFSHPRTLAVAPLDLDPKKTPASRCTKHQPRARLRTRPSLQPKERRGRDTTALILDGRGAHPLIGNLHHRRSSPRASSSKLFCEGVHSHFVSESQQPGASLNLFFCDFATFHLCIVQAVPLLLPSESSLSLLCRYQSTTPFRAARPFSHWPNHPCDHL